MSRQAMEAQFEVGFLGTTKLGEKGQLTVPKEFRDALEMGAGAPLAVLRLGNGLLLIPEAARFRALCERIAKRFSRHGIGARALLATLGEARRRVHERHYPRQVQASRGRPKPRRT